MPLLLLLLLLLATPLRAEVAIVRGGEHPGFTRLVVDAPGMGHWRFGRTANGYELAAGVSVSGFDLSRAFDRIPRDRVSGLWRDPVSGRLRIAMSCACHAIAFEFRPGMVVIDVKSGAPPAGSAFENGLDGPPLGPALPPVRLIRPAGGYDWVAAWQGTAAPLPVAAPVRADFGPLREVLLMQISRGIAEGVIQPSGPGGLPAPGGQRIADAPGLRVSVDELPGVMAGTAGSPAPDTTATGRVCIADTKLDIAAWLPPVPLAANLANLRAGLLGEFDKPQEEAILRAARGYLALGFGAEARQVLSLSDQHESGDATMLLAMSHIVDLEPPPHPHFGGLAECGGAAALWSVLEAALSARPVEAGTDGDAVARSFSALPVHLRRHFGPLLSELLLASGDEATARLIRDATLRAPGEAPPEVRLMDARYRLATGEAAGAAAVARSAVAGAEGAEATVTLVEAAFRGGGALPANMPLQIAAFLTDSRAEPEQAALRRAQVLALAMTGDYGGAFAAVARSSGTLPDLWSLAARGAGDAVFLEQATMALRSEPTSALPSATRIAVAERLLSLGFPAEAQAWLGEVNVGSDGAARLLAARSALALRDAKGVIDVLAGMPGEEAEGLRAMAVLQLGEPRTAAAMFARALDPAAQERALILAGDWPHVAADGADPWRAVAALAVPATESVTDAGASEAGPLARGGALADDSAMARAAVEVLLAGVPALAP